ncbi:MAG: sigma-54 dependent transcriptional regulator [Nitrospirae bacterium YQR-1]
MTQAKPDLRGLSLLIVSNRTYNDIGERFEQFGGRTFVTTDVETALYTSMKERIDIVLADSKTIGDGVANFIEKCKSTNPAALIYLAVDNMRDAAASIVPPGIEDYLHSHITGLRFAQMTEMKFNREPLESTGLTVMDPLVSRLRPYFQFHSEAMRRALANLPAMAYSGQNVLISGETGTGKEIVARSIHVLSRRSSGPFVAVNCGAIPETLIEGELFGHEKGAFTGAIRTRKGKFEAATNGTLFLDEIGDMPLALQVRLLRVLEEGQIYRVGAETPVSINARIIAATSRELKLSVQNGLFRDDLYYRLNILPIHLPPLRQRTEDIPYLSIYFLSRAFNEQGVFPPYPNLSPATIDLMEKYPWRGNVRELRNVMTRVATLLPPDTTQVLPIHIIPHLEDNITSTAPSLTPEPSGDGILIPIGTPMNEATDMIIAETLRHTGGNRTKTAQLLKIGLRTLRRRLNQGETPQ